MVVGRPGPALDRETTALVAALVLATALAGCSDDAGRPLEPDGAPADAEAPIPPVFGTIFDQERRPLSGVTVSLFELQQETTTDRNGSYRFEDVPADAEVLVLAQKEGYLAASQPVQMVPGFSVRVNLTLSEVAALARVVLVDEHRGLLECQLVANGPATVTGDCPGTESVRDSWQVPTYPRVRGAVLELFWDANAPSTGALEVTLEARTVDGWKVMGTARGESPLRIAVPEEAAADVDGNFYVAVAAATITDGPASAGTAFEQAFDAYLSVFYNQPGEDGYTIA